MLTRTLALAAALAFATPVFAQNAPSGEAAMLTPDLLPTTSGYAPVNGVEVWYQTYGEGDPLMLLHGGFGMVEMFAPIIPALVAAGHRVIGVDLQAHGRTLPFDRPMTFEAMADDIAGVITHLGLPKADVMGYSTGGGVAFRLAVQHPDLVNRLILVSTPYAFAGWHDYNQQGMRMMGPEAAEPMKQTPMYQGYAAVAPDVNNWPLLIGQMAGLVGRDYDWSAEIARIAAPTMLVVGDWDSVRTAHVAQFFELLGGGRADAGWDGANMNANRLAILPGETHYTIFMSPKLADAAIGFLAPAAAPPAN